MGQPLCRSVRTLALLAALAGAGSAGAQETATVSLPSTVTFWVTDVAQATTGSPSPTRIEISQNSIAEGAVLRVLIHAEAAELTPPPGCAKALSSSFVSWTVSGAWGGSASAGRLDAAFSTLILETSPDVTSAGVDLTWSLAAPGSAVCAGDYTLSLRWTIESVSA